MDSEKQYFKLYGSKTLRDVAVIESDERIAKLLCFSLTNYLKGICNEEVFYERSTKENYEKWNKELERQKAERKSLVNKLN